MAYLKAKKNLLSKKTKVARAKSKTWGKKIKVAACNTKIYQHGYKKAAGGMKKIRQRAFTKKGG